MIVFICLLILIGLLRVLFISMKFGSVSRKLYCTFIGLSLFAIGALRHMSVGNDVFGYVNTFYVVKYTSWSNLTFSKDPLYGYFVKTISYLGNHQIYLSIVAAIFALSISLLIYRYSDEPSFSFFALLPFSYFYFSMTGLRQTIAMSLLYYSFKYIEERNLFRFLLLVFIASLFHISALIFAIAYFVVRVRVNYEYLFIAGTIIILFYYFKTQITSFAISFFLTDRSYSLAPSQAGITTLATYILIFVFVFYFRRSTMQYDHRIDIYMNMLFLGIVFQILVMVQPNAFRVSMYFNVFNILLIPRVIESIKDRNLRLLSYVIVYCLLGFQYFAFTSKGAGVYPYRFFWS